MKFIASMIAVVLAFGLLPGSVRAQDNAPVRIGVTPIDPAGPGFYAADLGLYTKYGLNASVQMMGNSGAVLEALVGGSLDIGYVGITTGETAYKKGLPIVMIAPTGIFDVKQGRVGYIMLRNDMSSRRRRTSRGKRSPRFRFGTSANSRWIFWIDTNGGDWSW